MRSGVLVALALAATATVAQAEDRAAPRVGKVGLRVVQVFPDTRQALVLDAASGKRVLVGEGERVAGYDVVEIDDEQVIVRSGTRELVLVVDAGAANAPVPTAAPRATGLLDPYAAAPKPVVTTLDPYASSTVREVIAPAPQRAVGPVDPYATPTPTPAAPAPGKTPPVATPTPPVVTPTPPVATPTPPVATPTPPTVGAPIVEAIRADVMPLKRAELSSALSDFDRLAKDLGFARTAGGVRIATVPPGSYVWRLGLRPGDVVTAIDGAPLRSLDDAAAAYVRLGSAKALALSIERGSARGTLRFALR